MRIRKITGILLSIMITLSFMPVYAFEGGMDENAGAELSEAEASVDVDAPEEQGDPEASDNQENIDSEPEEADDSTDISKGPESEAGETEVIDSGTCGANLTWTLDREGVLTISGSGRMSDFYSYTDSVRAPWYIYKETIASAIVGEGVTSIGSYAFYDCGNMTSVELPDGITSIGSDAFTGCSNLLSLEIPNGVTSIGDYTFKDCSRLSNVEIPGSVTFIGTYAFYGCGLKSIVIPAGVKSIGNHAFSYCNILKNVVLPDSVTSIGSYAFEYCSSLTNVVIPESVKSISDYAFYSCSSLTSVVIPKSVTSIGTAAFQDCSSLTSISIPESVTSIGTAAFQGCSSLTSVEIPNSVTSIREAVFVRCSSLTSISIPESVTSIGSAAFYGCSSLTSVEIPEGVTSIEQQTFYNCSNLANIAIPGSVTSIGPQAFLECSSLTSVEIPEGVMSIGDAAFNGCSRLSNVEIPGSVTFIGTYAFYGCGLKSIVIPAGVKSIGNHAFSYCNILKNVVLPDSVTSIGSYAFEYCSSLTNVVIPESVKSISDYAFYSCSSLTSVEIPEGVTSIGNNAFYGCSSLTSVEIPDGVTSIGRYAFSGCSRLTSIYIPDTVTSVGDYVFGTQHIDIYTTPGSYISSIGIGYWHIVYMCDGADPDTRHIGFSTDTITMKSGAVLPLGEYLLSGFSLDECTVTLSDENLFMYDSGEIANLGAGECDITVSKDDLSATVRLIAQDADAAAINQLSLKDASLSMIKGEVTIETVTMDPPNANAQDIAWTSSDDAIVTVDNGKITAVGAGTATVTAQSKTDNSIKASCEVTVTVPLYDLCLVGDGPIIMEKGESKAFRYYKYPSDATDATVTFSSSDPGVVEISGTGKMTARGAGTATITISSGQISKTRDVQVYIPIKGISLNQTSAQVLAGKTLQLHAIYEPADTTERDVAWTSNKESVATVDENGLVTAHGKGIAKITATAGEYTATCTIVCPNNPITIISQPEDLTVEPRETVSFKVTAEGDGLNYQWQWKSGSRAWANTTLSGYNTDTLSFTATKAHDGRQYRCVVTDSYGESVESDAAALAVYEMLTITKQPEDISVTDGDKVTFKVFAKGEGLTYQWQWKSGSRAWANTTLSGYNTDTLSFTAQTAHNGRQYRCVITDKRGNTVESDSATLVVKAEAVSIISQPEDVTVEAGERAFFKVTATGMGLQYQWQWKSGSRTWANTTLSGYNTDTLSFTAAQAHNGRQYRCVVTDASGNTVESEGATLTVAEELSITSQPKDITVAPGEKASFSVKAKGIGLKYQWQWKSGSRAWSNTTLSGYNTNTLSFTAQAAHNGRQYRCVITDVNGNTIESDGATLTVVEALEITSQPEDVTVKPGEKATFKVTAKGTNLTYQWQWKSGSRAWSNTTLSGYNTNTLSFTAQAAHNGRQYRCVITDVNGNTIESKEATIKVIIASGVMGNILTWTLDSEGVLIISGAGYMEYGESPFIDYRSNIKTIIIKNGVMNIAPRAFAGCSGLTSITIPDTVTDISEDAFDNCDKLNTIYFCGTEEQWYNLPYRPIAENIYFLADASAISSQS